MAVAGYPTPNTRTRAPRHWRHALVAASALALLATVGSFALASAGVVSFSVISPPAGASSTGVVAQLVPLTPSTVTVPQGQSGDVIAGVSLARVVVAEGYAAAAKIDITWLDPQDAGQALHNPNSWLTFGLYYPIHTGSCTSGDPSGSITLTDASTLCAALDTQATGPLVDSSGNMIVSQSSLAGYMIEGKSDPSPASSCGATGTTWCAPSGLGLSSQNVFYVAAAITTPGGIPPGQQGQTASLEFYFHVHPIPG